MKARVYVTLKAGVLDTQGRAVQKTLGTLGFDEVEDVRIGKYIELEIGEPGPASASASASAGAGSPRERLTAMCDKLLANPVIEDYRLEIVDSAGGESGSESDAEEPSR